MYKTKPNQTKQLIDKTCTVCRNGVGREGDIYRDGEKKGEEISKYLIKHPNNQVYRRGKDKEMKLRDTKGSCAARESGREYNNLRRELLSFLQMFSINQRSD